MTTLTVELRTGGDDLREGSWANFFVNLTDRPSIKLERFVEGKQDERSDFKKTIDVPELTTISQWKDCAIEHVSQESFGQTRDNWNILRAEVSGTFELIPGQMIPVVLGRYDYHRFEGSTATLVIPRAF